MTVRIDIQPGAKREYCYGLPPIARALITSGADPSEDWKAGYAGRGPHVQGVSLAVLAGMDQCPGVDAVAPVG